MTTGQSLYESYLSNYFAEAPHASRSLTGWLRLSPQEQRAWIRMADKTNTPSCEGLTFRQFIDVVQKAMQDYRDFAYVWHDNIACTALDEGIEHPIANKIATRVMELLFNVDTRRP